jgi:tetratricopeptide (TPR) repeat protein
MAYLKLQEYAKAEADCNTALLINHLHAKSLYRRGLARKKLEKLKEAAKVRTNFLFIC